MYDFHYNFIKKYFGAELLFADTYSLTYEIKSEDVYKEVFKHKHLFHFSNYPKDSNFLDPTNKKGGRKMKNGIDRVDMKNGIDRVNMKNEKWL